MKIAIFYNLYFSGAKRTVYEHTKRLKTLGHQVDVYTIDTEHDIFDPGSVSSNDFRYEYKKKIVNVPFLKKVTADINDFIALRLLHKKIAQHIDSGGYDIALIHTDQITQAPFILRYLQTKNAYFCLEPLKIGYEYGLRVSNKLPLHNQIYETANRFIRKRIDRKNARAAYASFSISKFGRELMISAFDIYPKVSYLGVDTSLFKKTNIKKKKQVLFIGQKLAMNGYEEALKAVEAVPKDIRPELKVVSISKNKKKRLSDKDMVKLYNESLVTLSLSNYDTFGLVPLESLACGTPVIAFDVAGYRETMIDKKTGYLVDFGVQEISEKLTVLLSNERKREEMGKYGREWIEENWTWEKQVKDLESELVKIINR